MTNTMQRPSPADLLSGVIAAAENAGALIRAEFHRDGGPRGQGSKAAVDDEVEELLKAQLQRLHPCRWNGEETTRDRIDTRDIWVVDPHDGTRDFLKRHRGSAISIALLRDRRPVLGVVFAPVAPDDRGDLIAWAEGSVLTRNGSIVPRRTPSTAATAPVLALNADAADFARHNHQKLPGIRIRALPSPAYRLALAAASEVDVGASLVGGLDAWDIAGAHALLIGAGLPLVDLLGKAVDYRVGSFDGVVGGRAEAVDRIVAAGLGAGKKVPRQPARPAARIGLAERLSRAQGCLLGQLAGDALGSAVEFLSEGEIGRRHPHGVTQLVDGGTWNLIAGQPTDDSEMALALARTIVKEGRFNPTSVSAAYVAWRASGPFDIGGTTANSITALSAGRIASSDSQANGALMRVSPIGILAAGDPARAARLAREDAGLTHPHPVCGAANAAYAAGIAAGIAGAGAEEIWAAAHANAGHGGGAEAVRFRLIAARHSCPDDYQHQMGWVLTALQNAFFWLMRGAPMAEALPATVARGGDTDTNAAICGALLGAAQGRDAVPRQWRNAVLTCRPVAAPGIRHPRPADYWPDDALDLAEALLAAGA
ncbi:inositol monophosphatase family protein [Sedimentimonas flavescens]|uniref:inositol monophosphatase family protein n=1 Tax=Sedimentimonas flavescens TaxID=2851012 RepID=UPI0021A7AAF2|nr:inositol monophosphatase family protein [Sedimentimonas flavescens]MCT2539975.1 ADP-ribosylglycohydrolase family protein [Sedimentimonas flavescens]